MTNRSSLDFLLYYAGVCMREARARRGTPFASMLVGWARRAHSEAVRLRNASRRPEQLSLFA